MITDYRLNAPQYPKASMYNTFDWEEEERRKMQHQQKLEAQDKQAEAGKRGRGAYKGRRTGQETLSVFRREDARAATGEHFRKTHNNSLMSGMNLLGST